MTVARGSSITDNWDVLARIAEYWPSVDNAKVCRAWHAANLKAAVISWQDPRIVETAKWLTGEDGADLRDAYYWVRQPEMSGKIMRISGLLRQHLPLNDRTVNGARLLPSGSLMATLLASQDRSLCILWDAIAARDATHLPAPFPPPAGSLPSDGERAQAIRAYMNEHRETLGTEIIYVKCTSKGLTCLPKELRVLSCLQHLHLGSNLLTALPEGMAELPLFSLTVFKNRISVLPKSLPRMTRLYCLSVSENPLNRLPEEFADTLRLGHFSAAATGIDALPEAFRRMDSLHVVDISRNHFSQLPEWLGELPNLERLDVSRNQLTALPDTLSRLLATSEVNASHNQIHEVSEEVRQALGDRLDLRGNSPPPSRPPSRWSVVFGQYAASCMFVAGLQLLRSRIGACRQRALQATLPVPSAPPTLPAPLIPLAPVAAPVAIAPILPPPSLSKAHLIGAAVIGSLAALAIGQLVRKYFQKPSILRRIS